MIEFKYFGVTYILPTQTADYFVKQHGIGPSNKIWLCRHSDTVVDVNGIIVKSRYGHCGKSYDSLFTQPVVSKEKQGRLV